jgi:hypothetical protein
VGREGLAGFESARLVRPESKSMVSRAPKGEGGRERRRGLWEAVGK